jgi:hypothetical protein
MKKLLSKVISFVYKRKDSVKRIDLTGLVDILKNTGLASENKIQALYHFYGEFFFDDHELLLQVKWFEQVYGSEPAIADAGSAYFSDLYDAVSSRKRVIGNNTLLFRINQLLIIYGLYDLALQFRKLYSYFELSNANHIASARAAFENNVIKKYPSFHIGSAKERMLKLFQILLRDKDVAAFSANMKTLVKAEPDFDKLIRGKRVFIAGPLSDGIMEEDVKEFDVMIFIKSQKISLLKQFRKFTLIAYYNAFNIRKGSFDDFYKSHENTITFFCLKKSGNVVASQNVRIFINNPVLLCGGPMMLQNILFDILTFAPEKIRISSFNFYATAKIYADQYLSTKWFNDTLFKRTSFADHDLLANFLFVRHLVSRNIVEADEITQNVLAMTDEEYYSTIAGNH